MVAFIFFNFPILFVPGFKAPRMVMNERQEAVAEVLENMNNGVRAGYPVL